MPPLTPLVKITVEAPTGGDTVVLIYKSDGSSPARAWTTSAGTSLHSQPVTVTGGTSTDFWVQQGQGTVVSAKINGVELAGGYKLTRALANTADSLIRPPADAYLVAGTVATAQSINAQTGTTYTLVAGDVAKLVTLSNGSAITLTVPQDSDATIAVGEYVDLYQLGAGQVTVAAGTGATLRTSGLTAKARAQYSRLAVQKVSANTWSLMGDLAAS